MMKEEEGSGSRTRGRTAPLDLSSLDYFGLDPADDNSTIDELYGDADSAQGQPAATNWHYIRAILEAWEWEGYDGSDYSEVESAMRRRSAEQKGRIPVGTALLEMLQNGLPAFSQDRTSTFPPSTSNCSKCRRGPLLEEWARMAALPREALVEFLDAFCDCEQVRLAWERA